VIPKPLGLDLLAPPLCWSCRSPAARGDPLCRACRRVLRFLGPAPVALGGVPTWAPLAYDGPAADLVRALKFRGATAVASAMAALIVANAPAGLLAGALVPVPLHRARRRARPFNQAELIAAAIAARTGLGIVDCLRRTGPDRRQVGRGRAARITSPGGVQGPAGARSPPVALLVDDVVTTGATLAACAAALRAAGAEQVAAIAFARTVGR
jgi:predicted amidophosphoribosyltransferase